MPITTDAVLERINARTAELHALQYHSMLERIVSDSRNDDTARLVFADWLEERGEEERAEFIRLQIKVHRNEGKVQTPDVAKEREQDDRRLTALVNGQHPLVDPGRELNRGAIWMIQDLNLEMSVGMLIPAAYWHRGFVSRISVTPIEWDAYHEAITKYLPIELVVMPRTIGLNWAIHAEVGKKMEDWILDLQYIGKTWAGEPYGISNVIMRLEHQQAEDPVDRTYMRDVQAGEWPDVLKMLMQRWPEVTFSSNSTHLNGNGALRERE